MSNVRTFISMSSLTKYVGKGTCKTPQNVSSNTRSNSAVEFLLDKYHECRAHHTQCNAPKRPSPMVYPSRLLDVGTQDNSSITVRSTDTFCEEEYACLSHCWGTGQPLLLNAQTQSALSKGINVTQLPQTFQDAISVVRRLRLRYLWIDSLYALAVAHG